MSRLFALHSPIQEIADHFGVSDVPDPVGPRGTFEGEPGLIVLERDGNRITRELDWGFPRHSRAARAAGELPGRIGLVADLTNPMWEHLVVDPRYRCLIPLNRFANPVGDPGAKTRTWFSRRDLPLTAWAGFCRDTAEFGPVFAGMTQTANDAVMPYNDRMPVLLKPDEYTRWLTGSISDVIGFQFRDPPPADVISILHTDDRWKSGKLPPNVEPQMSLL